MQIHSLRRKSHHYNAAGHWLCAACGIADSGNKGIDSKSLAASHLYGGIRSGGNDTDVCTSFMLHRDSRPLSARLCLEHIFPDSGIGNKHRIIHKLDDRSPTKPCLRVYNRQYLLHPVDKQHYCSIVIFLHHKKVYF